MTASPGVPSVATAWQAYVQERGREPVSRRGEQWVAGPNPALTLPLRLHALGQAQQPQGFKDTPHGRGRSMYPTNRMLVETCPCPRGGISKQNPSNSRGRGSRARGGLVPRDLRSHLTFLGYWGFIPLCTPWSDPPVGCRTVLGTCPTLSHGALSFHCNRPPVP